VTSLLAMSIMFRAVKIIFCYYEVTNGLPNTGQKPLLKNSAHSLCCIIVRSEYFWKPWFV